MSYLKMNLWNTAYGAQLSNKFTTSVDGLVAQYLAEIRSLQRTRKTVSISDKAAENQFLQQVRALSQTQLAYIDMFVGFLAAHRYSKVHELIQRYSRCPEKLARIVDFINLELHRRDLQDDFHLSAVVAVDAADSVPFGVVYVFQGWTSSGRPRYPKSFRTN